MAQDYNLGILGVLHDAAATRATGEHAYASAWRPDASAWRPDATAVRCSDGLSAAVCARLPAAGVRSDDGLRSSVSESSRWLCATSAADVAPERKLFNCNLSKNYCDPGRSFVL